MEATFNACRGPRAKRVWVLDADLAAAFDRIDHNHLLAAIGDFPARGMVADWLKAGVIESGKEFAPTGEGTPQGGVISPLLMNVALHGLEEAAGIRYTANAEACRVEAGSPVLVRYADDMIALCHSQEQAEQVKARLAEWLAPRGLVFNEDKTRIVHLSEGFDFLGFNVRRYRQKLLIKPSKAAIRRLRKRLASEMRALRGSNAAMVITKLNPIIKGWAAYYRSVVSKKTFQSLDYYLWQLLYKWATWSHGNKPKAWVVDHYFGKHNKFRNDRWVFGAPGTTAYVVRFSWTDIVRHIPVKGGASLDDPKLTEYWAKRRKKAKPPLDNYTMRLLTRQDVRCPLCGDPLLIADQPPESPDQWQRWWLQLTRKAIAADYLVHHGRPGTPDGDQTRLVHASCHRRHLARPRRGTAQQQPEPPSRLA
nr:reverse transcriptase domain-containing protein [Nonomuraea basaltis]